MFKPELIRRVLRFGLVGGAVTLFNMALNWYLAPRLGKTTAFFTAYPLGVALHFSLNKWWTFGDHSEVRRRQVSEYLALVIAAFLIQTAVFKLLITFTPIPSWLAVGLATVAQVVPAFFFMQWRVFAGGQTR